MKTTVLLFLLVGAIPAFADTIALWTFETSQPTTAGPYSPEVGSGAASGYHAGATIYSSPVGNGSAHSYSANGWSVGDYWQFQVSTLGFEAISISWNQAGSSTGPGDFILQFSTDGTSFSQVGSDYLVPLVDWTSGSFHNGFTFTPDLSGIAALIADQANVYFRLVDNSSIAISGASVGGGGTDRVDNFLVTGSALTASVPDTLPAGFSAVTFLILLALARGFAGASRPERPVWAKASIIASKSRQPQIFVQR